MLCRSASIRNRPVALLIVICAAGLLAGTMRAGQAQTPPSLPRPISSPGEERMFRSLEKPTNVEWRDLALEDCVTYLGEFHNLKIRVDKAAVATAGISLDSPVTLNLNQTSFQRTLETLLDPLGLDSFVAGSELVITTRAAAIGGTRTRLEKSLEHEIQLIDHFCELTEMQKQKLRLAGRRDVERLLDGIQERREKIQRIKNDETRIKELLAEMAPLRQKISAGPFDQGALFRKAVEKSLTDEQAVKYGPIREVLQAGGIVGTVERDQNVTLAVVLFGNGVTDENLTPLKRLKTLGILRLIATKVTDAGLADLQQALPALKIEK